MVGKGIRSSKRRNPGDRNLYVHFRDVQKSAKIKIKSFSFLNYSLYDPNITSKYLLQKLK